MVRQQTTTDMDAVSDNYQVKEQRENNYESAFVAAILQLHDPVSEQNSDAYEIVWPNLDFHIGFNLEQVGLFNWYSNHIEDMTEPDIPTHHSATHPDVELTNYIASNEGVFTYEDINVAFERALLKYVQWDHSTFMQAYDHAFGTLNAIAPEFFNLSFDDLFKIVVDDGGGNAAAVAKNANQGDVSSDAMTLADLEKVSVVPEDKQYTVSAYVTSEPKFLLTGGTSSVTTDTPTTTTTPPAETTVTSTTPAPTIDSFFAPAVSESQISGIGSGQGNGSDTAFGVLPHGPQSPDPVTSILLNGVAFLPNGVLGASLSALLNQETGPVGAHAVLANASDPVIMVTDPSVVINGQTLSGNQLIVDTLTGQYEFVLNHPIDQGKALHEDFTYNVTYLDGSKFTGILVIPILDDSPQAINVPTRGIEGPVPGVTESLITTYGSNVFPGSTDPETVGGKITGSVFSDAGPTPGSIFGADGPLIVNGKAQGITGVIPTAMTLIDNNFQSHSVSFPHYTLKQTTITSSEVALSNGVLNAAEVGDAAVLITEAPTQTTYIGANGLITQTTSLTGNTLLVDEQTTNWLFTLNSPITNLGQFQQIDQTFQYTMTSANGQTSHANINIKISGDEPIAIVTAADINANLFPAQSSITGNILAGEFGFVSSFGANGVGSLLVDGQSATNGKIVVQTTDGTLTVYTTAPGHQYGSFVYQLNSNAVNQVNGQTVLHDPFTFKLIDSLGNSVPNLSSSSFTINIYDLTAQGTYYAFSGNDAIAANIGLLSNTQAPYSLHIDEISSNFGSVAIPVDGHATLETDLGGQVTVTTSGSFEYTPPNGVTTREVDHFQYQVSDYMGGVSTTTATIYLGAPVSGPSVETANWNDSIGSQVIGENLSGAIFLQNTFLNLTLNDTNGFTTLEAILSNTPNGQTPGQFYITGYSNFDNYFVDPTQTGLTTEYGQLSGATTGSGLVPLSYGVSGNVFTASHPLFGEQGISAHTDSFYYQVSDGYGSSIVQQEKITIADRPVVTDQIYDIISNGINIQTSGSAGALLQGDDSYWIHSGQITGLSITGVLFDPTNSQNLNSTVEPLNTTLSFDGGNLKVQSDGSFTFDGLAANFQGKQTFEVLVSDGQGGVSTESVTINQYNQPLTTFTDPAQSFTINELSAFNSTTGALLSGDLSNNGNGLTVAGVISGGADWGVNSMIPVSMNGVGQIGDLTVTSTGSFTYTPSANTIPAASYDPVFEIVLSDGNGQTSLESVYLSVQPITIVANSEVVTYGGSGQQVTNFTHGELLSGDSSGSDPLTVYAAKIAGSSVYTNIAAGVGSTFSFGQGEPTVVVDQNGNFSVTQSSSFTQVSLELLVRDSVTGVLSGTQVVTISDPIVTNQTDHVYYGGGTQITNFSPGTLLTNDTGSHIGDQLVVYEVKGIADPNFSLISTSGSTIGFGAHQPSIHLNQDGSFSVLQSQVFGTVSFDIIVKDVTTGALSGPQLVNIVDPPVGQAALHMGNILTTGDIFFDKSNHNNEKTTHVNPPEAHHHPPYHSTAVHDELTGQMHQHHLHGHG